MSLLGRCPIGIQGFVKKERGTEKERKRKERAEKGRASSAPLSQENNDSKEFKRFVNCCVEQNNRGKLSQCTVQLSCSSYCPQVCTVHDFQSTTLQISKPRVSRITFSDFQMPKNDSSSFLLASDVLFCSLQGHRKPNHSFTISISFYICIYIYIHIHISIYIHLLIIDIATSISLSISIYIHWYTNIDPFIYHRYSRYIIVYIYICVMFFMCTLFAKKSGATNLKKTPRVALVSNLTPLFHPRQI